MCAKAYDKKTAAFAGFVIQNIPADLTDEEMDGWMDNPDATKKFLSGLKPPAPSAVVQQSALFLVSATNVDAVAGKPTGHCFTDKPRWYFRDSDIDGWLLPMQSAQSEGVIGVYQLREAMTFREMAARAAQMTVGTSPGQLAAALKERGHVLTLADIETMVEKQESGEDVGLCTNGWANFAFVEDANGSVSVLSFSRGVDGWDGYVGRLDVGHRWLAGSRLLLRNSVASAL